MQAALREPPVAGAKWIGGGDNAALGLPHISGLIVLNDLATGVPMALLDGNWITAVRSGAVSAVAARRLARPDSAGVGCVGCGVQARSNLAALRRGFPIRRVLACGRRRAGAEAFAREVAGPDLEVRVVDDARAAVEGADIVVSSVPAAGLDQPFLDPAWLSPGSFASLVDLGRSWRFDDRGEPERRLDCVATDDHEQSRAAVAAGLLSTPRPFDADLGELVSGAKPGRKSPGERTMFIFPGLALADIAVAALVYRRAREQGLGTLLAL
jgi:ornithine cyclodeaminase/alanine dehydrogenase